MWGWVVKVAGWVWAHKNEIMAGIQVWKALRAKRKASDQPAGEYWKGQAKDSVARIAADAVKE